MRAVGSVLVALALASRGLSYPSPLHRDLRSRNVVYNGQIKDSYDFVIAGGGLAGLVLASRLSEDANTTVLVLEAGDTGDAVKSSIDIPGNAYYSSLLGTSYDWQFNTAPQANLSGRTIPWARGKVLGGSSAVNGLYLVRPSQLEVDAWANMQNGATGATAWSWDSLFAAMKKSENFTAPSAEIQQEGAIEYDSASHGTSGPLHYSYPGYILPVVGNWTQTVEDIGIPASPDSNAGKGWGGFIATSAINPTNWTRSYSRSAYIDPLPPRANLDILANATVTRMIFASNSTSGNLTANSVEYASVSGGALKTVNVTREVILAGGAIGSPNILMHSGVGPKDVLTAAGVTVQSELPAVGQHLQDHLSGQVVWKTSEATAASIESANTTTASGTSSAFMSFINSATAYANITDLLGFDFAPTFKDEITAAINTSAATLVPSTDAGVIAGYKAIYNTGAETILMTQVGQIELLLSLTGTAVGGSQSIAIQAALQRPFSQGRVYINSSNPFDAPVIDPNYLSHFAATDKVMLREGLKLARKIGQTAPLNSAFTTEVSPGSSVSTDDDWDNWLVGQVGTEYHPSCTCAMLPQDQGGVVDPNLKVYGLANVRVIDASIFPISFAAHLMAQTYGVAEQGAEIIRALYNGVAPPSKTTTATAGASASASASNSGKTSGSLSSYPSTPISICFTAALSALLGTLIL
ncbi:hypothetical protein PLICRDRAFT_31568 [Plicaturopsis crispa FD-325 SS-3]|nr:hypothetical protein PLICRDRAFT_31568 [Plicaturopsis crispa FD-325 SS-3]